MCKWSWVKCVNSTPAKAKQRACVWGRAHALEDTANTASRPVTRCTWPGSACTQPWNNNRCLVCVMWTRGATAPAPAKLPHVRKKYIIKRKIRIKGRCCWVILLFGILLINNVYKILELCAHRDVAICTDGCAYASLIDCICMKWNWYLYLCF